MCCNSVELKFAENKKQTFGSKGTLILISGSETQPPCVTFRKDAAARGPTSHRVGTVAAVEDRERKPEILTD
jgi:hypothetical protein